MAIQRLNLTTLQDLVRLYIGEETTGLSRAADSDSSTNKASLTAILNAYGQQIPNRLVAVMESPEKVWPDFWRTSVNSTTTAGVGNLVVTAASQTMTLPDNFDRFISMYDRTHFKRIYPVEEVSLWHLDRLRKKAPGPAEAFEFLGVNATSNRWEGKLWPSIESGVTPDIELTYWRIPASMPDTTPASEYPDAPPQFHLLWVWGAVLDLLRPDDPAFTRYAEKEKLMLTELSRHARMI